MTRLRAVLFVLVTLLIPGTVSAAGMMLKIRIQGGDLAHPIEISDKTQMRKFAIGGGPGAWCAPLSNPVCAAVMERSYAQSFIVDWAQGVINPPAQGVINYDVEFLMSRPGPKNTYRVTYSYDPVGEAGFVHIPGADDPRYGENISLIRRGVEGNWYRAWHEWDTAVATLIKAAH